MDEGKLSEEKLAKDLALAYCIAKYQSIFSGDDYKLGELPAYAIMEHLATDFQIAYDYYRNVDGVRNWE